jgi:hypothetical protein
MSHECGSLGIMKLKDIECEALGPILMLEYDAVRDLYIEWSLEI